MIRWRLLLALTAVGGANTCRVAWAQSPDVPVAPSDGAALKLLAVIEMPATPAQEAWLDSLKHAEPMDQLVMRYREPAFYAAWWAEVARCSGLPTPASGRWRFGAVRAGSFPVEGRAQVAYTFARARLILVVQPAADKRAVIEHEMLHATLAEADTAYVGGHDEATPLFARCRL